MANPLYGTLGIDGDTEYEIIVRQNAHDKIWILCNQGVLNKNGPEAAKHIVAVLRTTRKGQAFGCGKSYIISRMLDTFNAMASKTARFAKREDTTASMFLSESSYRSDDGEEFFHYKNGVGNGSYAEVQMVAAGFRLSIGVLSGIPKFSLPQLDPIMNKNINAAVIAGLGIRTAAMLRERYGGRLDFFDRKRYTLVDTNEKFRVMMLNYLEAVATAAANGRAVYTGLDTETTGLKMYRLSPDNPAADHIVAIPFAWKDDEGYLVCTDMEYFSNVDSEEIYPLFRKLFGRNDDFTGNKIVIDYCGRHFEFHRDNILVAGANAIFDMMAFLCHDCDLFFDDDIQIILYNIATDWVQGKNSLKNQTRLLIGDETLELEELFGSGNKDKFRYLQDPLLAQWYGAADGDYTRLVGKKAIAMSDRNLLKLYRKYDMTFLHTLAHAAWIGLPADTLEVRRQGALVKEDLETLKHVVFRYAYAANKDNITTMLQNLEDALEQQRAKNGEDDSESIITQAKADTLHERASKIEKDREFCFEFKPANHKELLFNVLRYPVIKWSDNGTPAFDKFVRQKLMAFKREEPLELMLEDIPSKSDPSSPLIDKEKFNSYKYPLAYVYERYALLNKEYDAYYKPIMKNDLEGRIFFNFSMARAATRRILSAGQTMKGALKSLIKAKPGKMFLAWDVSQMEYRLMAEEAYQLTRALLQAKFPDDWEDRLEKTHIAHIHEVMSREESDYHIETAAFMTGVPQHKVDKKTRKSYKKVGFGIPYGLSIMALCEDIFGDQSPEHMAETKKLYDEYCTKQVEIITLIETKRDSAFRPVEIPDSVRQWMGIGDTYVGKVYNHAGFYRMFILENLTRANTGSIRRKAGNCFIQGGAAEYYRRQIYNLTVALAREGMLKDVDLEMVVHDEGDYEVSRDIDVMKLISLIYDSCVLRYPGCIPYWVGIGFGDSWADAKDDGSELPIRMVRLMIEAWRARKFDIPRDGRQPENLLTLKRHYLCDRIEEELLNIIPHLKAGHVWTDEDVALVDEEFSNYIVRAYLEVFSSSKNLKMQLTDWQQEREKYGFGVKFLTRTFDAKVSLNEMTFETLGEDLDIDTLSASDLAIEILENDADYVEAPYTGEAELFDYDLAESEIERESGESRYVKTFSGEGDLLEDNDAPSTGHDVFKVKGYIRTAVFKTSDSSYSAILSGTKWAGKEDSLVREMANHFSPGTSTIVLVGNSIKKVAKVATEETDLDWLDKTIKGVE